jgi:hypothetical protein
MPQTANMNKGFLFLPVLFMCFSTLNVQHSDASIFGDVQYQGEPILLATIPMEGSTIGKADISAPGAQRTCYPGIRLHSF